MKSKLAAALAGGGATLGAYSYSRKTKLLKVDHLDAPTKVVILGGGFGGLAAARELAHSLSGIWTIILVAISTNIEVRHAAHSIRRIIKPLRIEFFQEHFTGVDFEAHEIQTEEDAFPYNYLSWLLVAA